MTDKQNPDIVPRKKQGAGSLAAAYFVARLGIFAAILALFWAFGFRGLPGALSAAIVSIPVSFYLLSGMRVRVAQRMEERKIEQLTLKDEFRTTGKTADPVEKDSAVETSADKDRVDD